MPLKFFLSSLGIFSVCETIISAKKDIPVTDLKKSVDKVDEKKTDKTRQELDREKLDKKFSNKDKEKLN